MIHDVIDLFAAMTEEVKIKIIKKGYSFQDIMDLYNEYEKHINDTMLHLNYHTMRRQPPFTFTVDAQTRMIIDITFEN